MPRTTITDVELSPQRAKPLARLHGSDVRAVVQALVTWGTSAALRDTVIERSGFPLPGDMQAFLLVNQLVYRGAASPTEMADAMQTGRSNVSKIVRRLEEADLVQRIADPKDDRGVVVALTDTGRVVGLQIMATAEMLSLPPDEDWSAEDRSELERLMVKMTKGIDRATEGAFSRVTGLTWD